MYFTTGHPNTVTTMFSPSLLNLTKQKMFITLQHLIIIHIQGNTYRKEGNQKWQKFDKDAGCT